MVWICSIALAFSRPKIKKANALDESLCLNFDTVYEENFAFVWRTARALGVPPALIDDAVQEVFIVVHRRLSDFRPEASVRSWVFGVVRRVAKDFRRSDKRRGSSVEVTDEHLGSAKGDPYVVATHNQALRLVEDFALTLDDERRALFVLSELEQMPTPEVASALDLNINTVYSRLKALRQNLSTFVAERIGEAHGDLYE
jgi:RNA polymerase sigma-70 factor (ECF subfamily)